MMTDLPPLVIFPRPKSRRQSRILIGIALLALFALFVGLMWLAMDVPQ